MIWFCSYVRWGKINLNSRWLDMPVLYPALFDNILPFKLGSWAPYKYESWTKTLIIETKRLLVISNVWITIIPLKSAHHSWPSVIRYLEVCHFKHYETFRSREALWNVGASPSRNPSTCIPKYASPCSLLLKHTLRVTNSKYRESLDRFEKSKTLKLCLKNAFRELCSKMLFRVSKN